MNVWLPIVPALTVLVINIILVAFAYGKLVTKVETNKSSSQENKKEIKNIFSKLSEGSDCMGKLQNEITEVTTNTAHNSSKLNELNGKVDDLIKQGVKLETKLDDIIMYNGHSRTRRKGHDKSS